MIEEHIKKIERFKKFILKRTKNFKPHTAIIMGSGLSSAADKIKPNTIIKYSSIPGFLKSGVDGHNGQFLFGTYKNKKVVVMQGRFHHYEGHSLNDIALCVRLLSALGVKRLIVSAAVGSLHKNIKPGHLVVLNDHINLMGRNALCGNYHKKFGPMFVDLRNAYDKNWSNLALKKAKTLKIPAHKGVYLAVTGPTYETPAEIRAFKTLGADVVGMSVVPEVTAARQLGITVTALAWVTNFASGIEKSVLEHKDVLKQGKKMAMHFKKLLGEII